MKSETNTVLAFFENKDEAARAYGTFHKAGMGQDYLIDACALYTKDGCRLKQVDSFRGAGLPVHHALFGWMIGLAIGLPGGWKGAMTGALIGMAAGVVLDDHALRASEKCLKTLAESLPAGYAGIVLVADETSTSGINAILEQYSMRAVRSPFSDISLFHHKKVNLKQVSGRS